MKVCFVNALFYPFEGGIENHMYFLAKNLVELGVEVHVVTARLPNTASEEEINGVKVHRVPAKIYKIPLLYPPPVVACPAFEKHLRELDSKYNFDLFHLHNRWFPDFTVVRKYAREAGKPFILTIHNARPVGINAAYTVLGLAYEYAVGINVLKSADKLIATSDWVAHDISKYKIPMAKFVTVHNGVDVNLFSAQKGNALKRELGMPENDPLLVWAGRVIEQKGLPYLFKALSLVLKRFPNCKLALIGTGNQVKKLRKLSQKLGISHAVKFVGRKKYGGELNDCLRSADVFVLPSLWEVFPVAVLDAMASGLPIVTADAGGVKEMVHNGVNGFVVPKRNVKALESAIVKLLADNNLRDKMGGESRRIAEREFDWPKITQKVLEVYKTFV